MKNSAFAFTARHLSHYNAIVFLNTSGDAIDAGPAGCAADPACVSEQKVFEEYFRNGGGFVGIGSAIETNPGWQFLTDIVGPARPTRIPTGRLRADKLAAQTVTNKVADRVHDASKNLPEYWNLNDTYYNWTANVRGVSHILTTVSAAPFNKTGDCPVLNALTGSTMGPDHPVSWCKDYKGGRSYYTSHGSLGGSVERLQSDQGARRRDRVGRGPVRPGLQRLRRDRARELPADEDQRTAEPERADRLRPASRRARDPDRPPRRRAPAQPRHRDVNDHREHSGLHEQRGRSVRPRSRQQLRHQPLGLPLLLPAGGGQHQVLRRDDRSHELVHGRSVPERRRTDHGGDSGRVGSVDRLLPAVAVQVR